MLPVVFTIIFTCHLYCHICLSSLLLHLPVIFTVMLPVIFTIIFTCHLYCHVTCHLYCHVTCHLYCHVYLSFSLSCSLSSSPSCLPVIITVMLSAIFTGTNTFTTSSLSFVRTIYWFYKFIIHTYVRTIVMYTIVAFVHITFYWMLIKFTSCVGISLAAQTTHHAAMHSGWLMASPRLLYRRMSVALSVVLYIYLN